MAPVATNDVVQDQVSTGPVKNTAAAVKLFNPFYSPTNGADGNDNDGDYEYAKYKVRAFPVVSLGSFASAILLRPSAPHDARHYLSCVYLNVLIRGAFCTAFLA